jgi:hypothetical protein
MKIDKVCVPAVGSRVRDTDDGREGVVRRIDIQIFQHRMGVWLRVDFDDDESAGMNPDYIEPIDDGVEWTIVEACSVLSRED